MLVFVSPALQAGQLELSVRGKDGTPVADAALVVESLAAGAAARKQARATARMEQRGRRFVPELLVVTTATLVDFPNNDTVSHQVYSFSPAHPFQLAIYKGSAHPPIAFDKAGLVVLGCNIHDDMVGYILVTDSPYHAQTNAQGVGRVGDLPPGTYRVRLWAPRIADAPASLERPIEVTEQGVATLEFRLAKPLLAEPTPRPGRTEWDAY